MSHPAPKSVALRLLCIFTAASGFLSPAASSAAPAKPNLLFILADDLGYGDLGCYGCEDIKTPHLDQLAAEGLRFTDYYANGPVCSPTRAAFLTGRYQQRLGLDNALKSAGYVTGLSGKWHLGYDHERKPCQQGFDHFFGLLSGNHHYFQHMDRVGVYDLWLQNDPIHRDGEYTTDLITEEAIAFIEKHKDTPFFLFLSHAAPHFPWQGPDDRDKLVEPKKKNWQEGDRATYVAMIERMDRGIGEVLAKLDELGLSDNTLVVFSSDNGGHTYSRNLPLRDYKATLWEGGIRVPCIARWPGVLPTGETTRQVAITMDWTASFRRLASLPLDPDGEDGIDLLPLLTGAREPIERTLFWRRKSDASRKVDGETRAVRHGTWKYLEEDNGARHLFDLRSDPVESINLLESHPSLAQDLSAKITAWEKEISP